MKPHLTNQDDVQLVRRAQAKDQAAIQQLGDRLEVVPRMVGIADSKLRARFDEHDKSDIGQDSVAAVWQKLDRFDGRRGLENWVWGFVLNTARNRLRDKHRRSRNESIEGTEPVNDGERQSTNRMLDRETLETWLDRLDDASAHVIRLRHFSGLTFAEIARRIASTENTVKARYYRGLKTLRELVQTNRAGRKRIV